MKKLLATSALIASAIFFASFSVSALTKNITSNNFGVEITGSSYSSAADTNDFIQTKAIPVGQDFAPNVKTTQCTSSGIKIASSSQNASAADADYYKSYGLNQISLSEDGADKASFYQYIGATLSDSDNTYAEEYVIDTTSYYIMFQVSLGDLTLTIDDALATYSMFDYDHPEYYWLGNAVLFSYYQDETTGVYYVTDFYILTEQEYDTPAERLAADAMIAESTSEYLDAVSGLTTDYDLAKAIHDRIIAAIDYKYDSNGEPSMALDAHNIIGVLNGDGAVCEGYAKAYKYLLDLLNVPNVYVVSTDHAWSMVKIDNGRFYFVDSTWDDQPGMPGGIVYDYFLCGTNSFLPEHIPNSSSSTGFDYLYELPPVPENDYETDVQEDPISIANLNCALSYSEAVYDGTAKTPVADIPGLILGTDFTAAYSNNINVGTAAVTLTGINNYTGTVTLNFTITPKPISECTTTLSATTYTYDGTAKTPTVTVKNGTKTLVSGTDYNVAYSNNTKAGTATVTVTGKGNYSGTLSKAYTISKDAISSCTVTLSATSYTYSGSAKKPTVTVKDGTKTLVSGTDYTVAYSNNTKAGTATVTVTGKGNYSGTLKKTFTIKAKTIAGCKATLSATSYVYTGLAKKPSVVVKDGTQTLVNGTDYTVSYTNNIKVGTATVTVTGKGNYSGTLKKSFTIKLASTTAKITAGAKKASLSWNKVAGASGYQIYMSTSKARTYTLIKTTSLLSYTKTGLTTGKTYYFKVRAYTTVNGVKVYGAYSPIAYTVTK